MKYKSFNITINRIEVDRWISMIEPFKGIGTIYFDFEESDNETKIICTIEPYTWIYLTNSFLIIIVLLILSWVLINDDSNIFPIPFLLLSLWAVGIGAMYINWRFNLHRLEVHSKAILQELKLIS